MSPSRASTFPAGTSISSACCATTASSFFEMLPKKGTLFRWALSIGSPSLADGPRPYPLMGRAAKRVISGGIARPRGSNGHARSRAAEPVALAGEEAQLAIEELRELMRVIHPALL